MTNKTLQRIVLSTAITLSMTIGLTSLTPVAMAQSQDGSVAGHTAPGAEVTVRDPDTGFSRTTTASGDGSFRFPFLPIGSYVLEANRDGETIARDIELTVSLGKTTVVNAGADLDVIRVVGSRVVPQIDVTSTESALNISKVELERLPVDHNLLSVATLASGVNKGEFGGVSFGGSSVAENAVYINGLNVTDFYNRVGFSSVPYAFYEEFQVKTGGYSVEFGRTTGGVINAVTRSGTNEFEFGAEAVWEPSFLQSEGDSHFDAEGNPEYIAQYDEYDRQSLNFYAGGPIVRDKLFFFALYELRNYEPTNTNNAGDVINDAVSDDAFWGAKIDWQVNDSNLLELLAFSDENTAVTGVYEFDLATGSRGEFQNYEFGDSGGLNWSATWTTYLTDNLSARAMYGETERNFAQYSSRDVNCHRIDDNRDDVTDSSLGCTSNSSVISRTDSREQARLDFQWALGDHQVRFGIDHETNTSDHLQHYVGPNQLQYDIYDTQPGASLANQVGPSIVPPGVFAYVRTRAYAVQGKFETTATAFYLEDSWQMTDTLVVDAGLRWDAFDNKNSDGDTYIKMDDMLAPRLGFSWDVRGDGRSKVFANAGRYFLPVANVINIKQAGGFSDIRTLYVFEGLETFEYEGETYQRPILGPQIGPVDNSQGDGTVGDLRGEVDADMDPVYQDEIILGYQSMIDEQWSWGVRGIYRELSNAIDDMEITSNAIVCNGDTGYVGWVMANPGEPLTVWGDTNCDGESDAFVTIDTSQEGWSLYDDAGNYLGDVGYPTPERTYKALEFMVDRAWDDKWAFNASYTLAYSEGNYEGPVNSDTDFADSGRTENFDKPWVNFRGDGPLANDHRHQIKLRGSYGFNDNWQVGGTLFAQSGRPISAFGVGDPWDNENYHSFFICTANCLPPEDPASGWEPSDREWEHRARGSAGRTPWTYNLGLSLTYRKEFESFDVSAKFAVYNVLDEQRVIEVDDQYVDDIGVLNSDYLEGTAYQSPRFGHFVVTVDF